LDSDNSEVYTRFDEEQFCQIDTKIETYMCPEGYSCVEVGNPEFGLTNMDNIGYALLLSFELITLEGWTGFMY
jgi:hypothetical protein